MYFLSIWELYCVILIKIGVGNYVDLRTGVEEFVKLGIRGGGRPVAILGADVQTLTKIPFRFLPHLFSNKKIGKLLEVNDIMRNNCNGVGKSKHKFEFSPNGSFHGNKDDLIENLTNQLWDCRFKNDRNIHISFFRVNELSAGGETTPYNKKRKREITSSSKLRVLLEEEEDCENDQEMERMESLISNTKSDPDHPTQESLLHQLSGDIEKMNAAAEKKRIMNILERFNDVASYEEFHEQTHLETTLLTLICSQSWVEVSNRQTRELKLPIESVSSPSRRMELEDEVNRPLRSSTLKSSQTSTLAYSSPPMIDEEEEDNSKNEELLDFVDVDYVQEEIISSKRKKELPFSSRVAKKKSLMKMGIEWIANSRWVGQSCLTPTIDILTFLSCTGGCTKSFSQLLSGYRFLKSYSTGMKMRKDIAKMEISNFHRYKHPEDDFIRVLFLDNYNVNKVIKITKEVGGKSTHLDLIVGFMKKIKIQTPIPSGQLNFSWDGDVVQECFSNLQGQETSSFIVERDILGSIGRVSVLETIPIPPIFAKSSSRNDILRITKDFILSELDSETSPILFGSDPEPSSLLQRISNEELAKGHEEYGRIVPIPGVMHLEKHLLDFMQSFPPFQILIWPVFINIFGYKQDTYLHSLKTSLDFINQKIGAEEDDGEFEDRDFEMFKKVIYDPAVSFPCYRPVIKEFLMLDHGKRYVSDSSFKKLNLPPFSQIRVYASKILQVFEGMEILVQLHPLLNLFFTLLKLIISSYREWHFQRGFLSKFPFLIMIICFTGRPILSKTYLHSLSNLLQSPPTLIKIILESSPFLTDELLELQNGLISRALNPYVSLTKRYLEEIIATVIVRGKLMKELNSRLGMPPEATLTT